MNPLFEKYLLAEMSEAERASLERELENNPDLRAQFEEERELMETLQSVMLRRTIKTALSTASKPKIIVKSNYAWFFRIILATLFLSLIGLAWKYFFSAAPVVPIEKTSPVQNATEPASPVAEEVEPLDKKNKDADNNKQPGKQLAYVTIEPHSLRGLRSNQSRLTPWAELVLKIWQAPFPTPPVSFNERYQPAAEYLSNNNTADAFLLLRKLERQVPGNDTLAFLKGYCLMQMWEGEGALRSFGSLSGKPHPWMAEVEWYQGLCYLLTGEKKKAIQVFVRIAAQKHHACHAQAEQALKLLQ